jgi:ATP synthase protein I
LTEKNKEKSVARQFLEASSVGVHLVLCTFAGFGIGYGLDALFDVSYLKFIFLFLGIIAGFREIFRVVNKQEDKDDAGTSAGDDPKNN